MKIKNLIWIFILSIGLSFVFICGWFAYAYAHVDPFDIFSYPLSLSVVVRHYLSLYLWKFILLGFILWWAEKPGILGRFRKFWEISKICDTSQVC